MIPALRAVGPARSAAKPLPWVEGLRPLYEAGVTFRHGQVIMIAGQPGSMKSAFATWMANGWNLPTLYVCADMSAHTAITRLAALRSGVDHERVSRAFASGAGNEESKSIEDKLASTRLQFLFDDQPSLDDIEEELLAWVEMYDDLPEVLVVDNLIDLDHGNDDEFRAWRETLLWLKGIARDYGITVVVLHHARELSKSDYPAPRKDLQGKVAQTPEIALSVSIQGTTFRVAVVKNRTGRQDAMARSGVEYAALAATMDFRPVGLWQTGSE